MPRGAWLVLIVACAAWSSPSRAQDDASSDSALAAEPTDPATPSDPDPTQPSAEDAARVEYARLVDEALREFGSGHFREAADVFRAAFALRPSARVLRGLGKAYFELGRYVEASTTFERALATELDPLEGALRVEVEELLIRSNRHVGTLDLSVTPPDAELLVDGVEVRPGPARLDEGTHTLRARAPGHEPLEREVRVTAQERGRVDLRLVARRSDPEERRPTLVAGGIVSAIGAAVVVPSSLWLADRARALSRCDSPAAGVVCANHGTLRGERRAAAATLAVGGATLLGGLALLVHGWMTDDVDATQASCTPSPTGATCVLRGSF